MAGIRKTTTQPLSAFKFTSMTVPLKFLTCILFLASSLDWMFYDHRPAFSCQALSMTTKSTSTIPITKLASVGRSQFAVFDGAEWNSVKSILRNQQRQTPQSSPSVSNSQSTKYGYMNVVTGKDDKNRRIVAMQCTDSDGSQQQASSNVYEDSVAVIPNKVSDADAISTYIASLSVIVCALPRLENIGGGGGESSTNMSTGKAVVLGSGDLACFSAEGLASLGMEVFMVNNKGSAKVRENAGKLRIIKPAVGDSEAGFASHLVEFDSLVDTIGNERTEGKSTMSLGSSMLEMLKSQHKCHNYVSTLTHSQDIILREGLLWGPRKADSYSEKIGNPAFLTKSRDSEFVFPPKAIGSTLETLMENGVILTEKQRNKACSEKSDAIRGWSLSDFWEQASWPRDSAGSGTTRFGLPVREDPDEIEDEDLKPNRRVNQDVFVYNDIGNDDRSSSRPIEKNPYVSTIVDIDGFKSEIVDDEKNCIMFMSARFCKTCKTINPAYTRMARIKEENGKTSNYSFVKAETSGASGKRLAKHVSVRAVPSFVFVREGKVLGSTYVSKLPHPKIDKAIQLLASGADWDYSLMDDPNDDDE